ncbi:MAG: CPBP family intramembrane metalloprotease [Pyrinomonadaceae bacterium]
MEIQEVPNELLLGDAIVNPDFSTQLPEAEPAELGRRVVIAFLAGLTWVISVAFIAFFPALLLYPYLASKGVPLTDTAQIVDLAKNDPDAIFIQIIAIIPAHIFTLLLAWLVISQGRKYKFLKTLGWERGGVRWWHYCVILLGFLFIAGIVGSFFPEQENDLLRILRSSRSAVYIIALVATFSAPLIEEVIYRGVLFSAFKKAFGVSASFVLVTILFALVHVPQYYPSFSTIFLLTLLSLTLTGIRAVSNNLLPCVILHTLFNGFQSVILLSEPYLRSSDQPAAAFVLGLFFK